MKDPTGPEDAGLARERTALAWTRTGLSFSVTGAVLLRLLYDGGVAPLGLAVALVVLGSVAWLWGRRTPALQPAIDSTLGRSTVRALALGTAAVAAAGAVVQLV